MSSAQFKLVEPSGIIRRVVFPSLPTWNALAARIHLLYGIAIENVSVAFRDPDDDLITLSSPEELNLFYDDHRGEKMMKFYVQDLASVPGERNQEEANSTSNIQGQFPLTPKLEDESDDSGDWQLPTLPLSRTRSPNINPDLFSNQSLCKNDIDADRAFNTSEKKKVSGLGKENVFCDETSSFSSFGDESVLDDFEEGNFVGTQDDVLATEPDATPSLRMPICEELLEHDLPPVDQVPAITQPSTVEVISDNCSNSSSSTAQPKSLDTLPSLSHDLSTLLNSFNSAITGHPELSEGIRSIIRNVSRGSYWTAHREAISQAAQGFVETADHIRRDTEVEASRRVSEVLDGVLQNFSGAIGLSTTNSPFSGSQLTRTATENSPVIQFTSPASSVGLPEGLPPNDNGTSFHNRSATSIPAATTSGGSRHETTSATGSNYARTTSSSPQSRPSGHYNRSTNSYPSSPSVPPGVSFDRVNMPLYSTPPISSPIPSSPGWNVPSSFIDSASTASTSNLINSHIDALRSQAKAMKAARKQRASEWKEAHKRHSAILQTEIKKAQEHGLSTESIPSGGLDNFWNSSSALSSTIPSTARVKSSFTTVSGDRGNESFGIYGHGIISRRRHVAARILKRLTDMGFHRVNTHHMRRIESLLPADRDISSEMEDNVMTILLEELLTS